MKPRSSRSDLAVGLGLALALTAAGCVERSLTVQHKASTADAAGGVQALAAATEAAAQELDQWLREFER